MSVQKQKLLETIENLPEELINKAMEYIEYIKFVYASNIVPNNLIIKDKNDLIEKIEEGIVETNKGNVCSLEDAYKEVKEILEK